MTAQPNHEDHQPAEDQTDPLGPITLPSRLRIGARAFALVGAASVLAAGVIEITEGCGGPITTVSAPH
jgi:hypothetical protein